MHRIVFIINIEVQIRWLLRIYSFCLLENVNVRLCVFHKLIANTERQTENKDAFLMPCSCYVREFLVPFTWAPTEQKANPVDLSA